MNTSGLDLTSYLICKDSGVEWIGAIPSHWEFLPHRAVFQEVIARDAPTAEMLSVTIGHGVIRQKELLAGSVKKDSSNLDKSAYKQVEPGDIVYNKMRAWQGAIGVSAFSGIVSPAYIVVRPRESQCNRFFHYLFRTPNFAREAERWSYGITPDQWSLRAEDFKNIYCVVPPLEEQQAIAWFLDRQDRRINRFIRAKRRLIELLNEQKQAIIHQAVTRGLDPNVPLKPSGIDWLGDIPVHWSSTRLKFETTHIIDCLHATPEYIDEGPYSAVRTADIEPGKLRTHSIRRVSEEQFALWTSRLLPEEGDILYSREGERFGIAAPVPSSVQLCISQRMMVFRIRCEQLSHYIMWQLNCPHVYNQASADTIGATSPHVNIERIRNFEMVLPPLTEQLEIVAHIEEQVRGVEALTSRAQDEIELVREYRARLIADVVTGKLDVRCHPDTLARTDTESASSESFEDESTVVDLENIDDIKIDGN